MSGTALADWALVDNPLRYTLQAAQQVDCPLAERDDELAACLRSKRVTELMNVRLQAPLYASPLAPLVDGIVVPNEPRQSMKTYHELFGRYIIKSSLHFHSFSISMEKNEGKRFDIWRECRLPFEAPAHSQYSSGFHHAFNPIAVSSITHHSRTERGNLESFYMRIIHTQTHTHTKVRHLYLIILI